MRKIIIIISVFLIVTGFIIVSLLLPKEGSSNLTVTKEQPLNNTNKSFVIKNYPDYKTQISQENIDSFANSISSYLKLDNLNNSYSGVIRDGSFKKSTNPDGEEIVYIVDIPELKRSYKASIGVDSTTGQNTTYLLCVSEGERIYPGFNCKDDLNA